jgi:CMP-N-acetylneuraminic acid synthetase
MQVLSEATVALEAGDVWPDIVVSLNAHTPLRRAEHIRKAVDTLLLYDVDSVISVYEDKELYYVHGPRGMEPLNPAMHRQIRVEREALYAGNGVVRVVWRDALDPEAGYEPTVGHIVMSRWDSFQIKDRQDAWLVEQVLLARAQSASLGPADWDKGTG